MRFLFTQAWALCLVLAVVLAGAQESQAEECISRGEIQELSQNFEQLKTLLKWGQKELCADDEPSKNFQLIQSLLLLKNSTPNEPDIEEGDAFTYKAIQEKDWWAYFTNRAKSFSFVTNCPPGVVAYVQPFFGNGKVNLCPPYFETNISNQASVLMHEVRHFDGHRHVTCTRGQENGQEGACDNRITNKGSYAISVQTLVALARSEQTEDAEKSILESQATYMAFNKFNELPELKMKDFILLSNKGGEVYKWNLEEEDASLVTTLNEPAILLNSFNNITIYPLDNEVDAYRTDSSFEREIEKPGLFAVHFNSETPEERAKYDAVMYFGDGGLLKDNELLTLCNREKLEIGSKDLSSIGNFVNMVSFADDEDGLNRKTYLLEESGETYSIGCANTDSDAVNIENTGISIEGNISASFPLAGSQFAISSGELIILTLDGDTFKPESLDLSFAKRDWISAAPLSVAAIFEE